MPPGGDMQNRFFMSDTTTSQALLRANPASYDFVPPLLAVIVPSFNERDNVGLLYEKLATALSAVSWEMIVVDDNSPDGTSDVVRDLAGLHSNIRVIQRLGRRGLSSACVEGIMSTAAPYIAVIDADLQHDEAILPQMLARADEGAELVIGSRFAGEGSVGDGLSATRLWGSNLATRLSSMVAAQDVSDPMSGFFLMRRDVFARVAPKLSPDGFKILLDLIVTSARDGNPLKIAEVPYQFRQRHAGESKMSSLVTLQFLGLWFSKLTKGLLPPTFLLFALVGMIGIGVHMLSLFALTGFGVDFLLAQVIATIVAMTSNFFLNNALTYADRRLRGGRLWLGLMGFYVVCSIGAVANISVAQMVYEVRHVTLLAGLAGALMSLVFNYAVTKAITWR